MDIGGFNCFGVVSERVDKNGMHAGWMAGHYSAFIYIIFIYYSIINPGPLISTPHTDERIDN